MFVYIYIPHPTPWCKLSVLERCWMGKFGVMIIPWRSPIVLARLGLANQKKSSTIATPIHQWNCILRF